MILKRLMSYIREEYLEYKILLCILKLTKRNIIIWKKRGSSFSVGLFSSECRLGNDIFLRIFKSNWMEQIILDLLNSDGECIDTFIFYNSIYSNHSNTLEKIIKIVGNKIFFQNNYVKVDDHLESDLSHKIKEYTKALRKAG